MVTLVTVLGLVGGARRGTARHRFIGGVSVPAAFLITPYLLLGRTASPPGTMCDAGAQAQASYVAWSPVPLPLR